MIHEELLLRAEGDTVRASARILSRDSVQNCALQAAIFERDPKTGPTGGRSWPGTGCLSPMVPACSTE